MRFLIIVAALALVACSKPPQQQAPAAATATTAASGPTDKGVSGSEAPVSTTPVATTPVIDQAFMVGRWGDNGDCNKDIVINADGSFTSYTGGEGQWSLNGDTLSLQGGNGTFDLRLELVN